MKLNLKYLSVKEVPQLFWSAPKALTIKPPLVSLLFLVVGLFLFGLGEALIVAAAVGVSPWTVFAQGVSEITGWGIGFSTFMISASVLVFWIPLRQSPGIGTVLNAIIIALVFSYVLPHLPTFDGVAMRVMEAIIGLLVTGFGGALYLIANLGPGPRDGLMTGLQGITHLPIAWVRTGIELAVVAIGWGLGGSVGLGTVMFALGIGPSVAISMYGLRTIADHRARQFFDKRRSRE